MKALVFTKTKSSDRMPIGVMSKKPSAAQIKAGSIEIMDAEDEDVAAAKIRIKVGRIKKEIIDENGEVETTYVCDAIATHPDDVDFWPSVDGFKTFEEFFGGELASEEFL